MEIINISWSKTIIDFNMKPQDQCVKMIIYYYNTFTGDIQNLCIHNKAGITLNPTYGQSYKLLKNNKYG